MTISTDTAVSGPYTASGSVEAYPFDFQAASATELRLLANEVSVPFTATLNEDGTGSATPVSVLEAGVLVYVESNPDFTQDADFTRFGPYFPDAINPHLDRAAQRDIALKARLERTIAAPPGADPVAYFMETFKGDPGAAGNVAATLAQLKAAATLNVTMLYDGATFNWTMGNFTGLNDDINIVKADSTSLTLGAWVRQKAAAFTYTAAGTGSRIRTGQDKLADHLSVADKGTTADLLAALNRVAADNPNGNEVFIPKGDWSLSATWLFNGQRMNVAGAGPNLSNFSFSPAVADVAIDFDSGGAGGQYQSSIRNLGFISGNNVTKTAIRLYNVANVYIHDIGCVAWGGDDSIWLNTFGRQKVEVARASIGCARPIVYSQNPVFPSLSTDHFQVVDSELFGTSVNHPVIEFENGVPFSSTTIRGTAIVGGKDGILWNDTGAAVAAAFHLHIDDVRFEQGNTAAAYALYLSSVNNSLQELLCTNVRFGGERNGAYLRQVRQATFINCTFAQLAGKTCFNYTMVAGSTLKFINCRTAGGTFTITNGRCISRSFDNRTGGFTEEWVFDGGFGAGAQVCDVWLGGSPVPVVNGTEVAIADENFIGMVIIITNLRVSAMFHLTGPTHTTQELLDSNGFFSNVKDTVALNCYWDTTGSNRYVVQNKRASGDVTISVLRFGASM